MNLEIIISTLDQEIAKLRQAREMLSGVAQSEVRRPGRPKGSGKKFPTAAAPASKKRAMTPEGRAKIAAAQRARWAAKKSAKA